MSYHIQPIAKKHGITKQIGWHTFRRTYTTLLHANGEDVKVVQELLRHGSAMITMDVYAQAVTPAKRKAQEKVVAMLRDTKKDKQTGQNCVAPLWPRGKRGFGQVLCFVGVSDGI